VAAVVLTDASTWEQRAVWWNPTWRYRIPVDITATAALVDPVVTITVNWSAVFTAVGASGTIDPASLRLVEYTPGGHIIAAYVNTLAISSLGFNRFDRCPIVPYRGDAGNLRALIPGTLAAAATRRFFLYFEPLATGKAAYNYRYLDATSDGARYAVQRVGPDTENQPSKTQAWLLPVVAPLSNNFNSQASNITYTFQAETLAPSTQYTASVWVKTEAVDVGTGVSLRYAETAPLTITYSSSKAAGTADWTQISATFTTSADITEGRLDIMWDLRSGETAWIDDVSLQLTAGGPELLSNPGFETDNGGFPANWQFRSTGEWDNTVARSGSASLKVMGAEGAFGVTLPSADAGAFAGLLVSSVDYGTPLDDGPLVQIDATVENQAGTITGTLALDITNQYRLDSQSMVIRGTLTVAPTTPLAVASGQVLHLFSQVTASNPLAAWTGSAGAALGVGTPVALAVGSVVATNSGATSVLRVDALTLPAVLGSSAAMTVTRTSLSALEINVTAPANGTWAAGAQLVMQFTLLAIPVARGFGEINTVMAGIAAGAATVTLGTANAYSLDLLHGQFVYYETKAWDWIEDWVMTHPWGEQDWNITFSYFTHDGDYAPGHDNDSSMGAGFVLYAACLKAVMTGETRYYTIADAYANYFLELEALDVEQHGSRAIGRISYGLNGGPGEQSFNLLYPRATAADEEVCDLSSFDQMATGAMGLWSYAHLDASKVQYRTEVRAFLGRAALYLQAGESSFNVAPNGSFLNMRTMMGLGSTWQGTQSDLPATGAFYVSWLAGVTTGINTGGSANTAAIHGFTDRILTTKDTTKLRNRTKYLASDTGISIKGAYPVTASSFTASWGNALDGWEFPVVGNLKSSPNTLVYTGGSPTSHVVFVGGIRDSISGRQPEHAAILAFAMADYPDDDIPVQNDAEWMSYNDYVRHSFHAAIAAEQDDNGAIIEAAVGTLGVASAVLYTKECVDLTGYFLMLAAAYHMTVLRDTTYPVPASGHDYVQGLALDAVGTVTSYYLGDLTLSQTWAVPTPNRPLLCGGLLTTPTLTFGTTGAATELATGAIALSVPMVVQEYDTGTVRQLPITITPSVGTVTVTPASWGSGGGTLEMALTEGQTTTIGVTVAPSSVVTVRRGAQFTRGLSDASGAYTTQLTGDGETADVVITVTAVLRGHLRAAVQSSIYTATVVD
jgi:hypothetical protein